MPDAPTPGAIGMALCTWCQEVVTAQEQAVTFVSGEVGHLVCVQRMAIGSLAHVEGRCSCYVPGATAGDPPGMTTREAAYAAVALWMQQQEDADHG